MALLKVPDLVATHVCPREKALTVHEVMGVGVGQVP